MAKERIKEFEDTSMETSQMKGKKKKKGIGEKKKVEQNIQELWGKNLKRHNINMEYWNNKEKKEELAT